MKCKNCGEEIANDSNYCEFCGAKMDSSALSSKKGRKILFWAILSIAIIVLIGLLTKWVNELSNVGSGAENYLQVDTSYEEVEATEARAPYV